MRIMVLFLFTFGSVSLNAAEISIEEFVGRAVEKDLNFKLLRTNKDKLKYLMDLGLPTRALMISASQEIGNTTDSSAATKQVKAQITKDILESGTSLSLNRTETTRPDREETVTEFRLEQALYKNFFGRDIRFKKELLEKQKNKIKMEIKELYESYVIDISSLYYEFAKSFYNVDLAQKILSEVNILKKNVAARRRKGVASSTDETRVLLQLAMAKEDFLLKQSELREKINYLQTVTGIGVEGLSPILSLKTDQLFNSDSVEVKKLRPYKISILSNEIAQGDRTLQERTNKADVNLVLGINKDDSVRFGTQVEREEKVIGLEVSVPLGDSLASAKEMELALVQKRSEIGLQLKEQELKTQITNAQKQIQTLKSIVEISNEKVKLTQKILREDEKRYQYGKVDLDRIIDLRKNYSLYRYQYLNRVTEFRMALLKWQSFSDKLELIKDF